MSILGLRHMLDFDDIGAALEAANPLGLEDKFAHTLLVRSILLMQALDDVSRVQEAVQGKVGRAESAAAELVLDEIVAFD